MLPRFLTVLALLLFVQRLVYDGNSRTESNHLASQITTHYWIKRRDYASMQLIPSNVLCIYATDPLKHADSLTDCLTH